MRKNILISTSNGWNPGDDFIRDGVLSLIDFHKYNWLYWNRAENVASSFENDLDFNLELCDYILFAGTPQWLLRNEKIYEYAIEHKIRMSLVGVGSSNKHPDWNHLETLLPKIAKSNLLDVVTTRDSDAQDRLAEVKIPSIKLPCPAGLVSNKFYPREEIKTVYIGITDLQLYLYRNDHWYIWLFYNFYRKLYEELIKIVPKVKIMAHCTVDLRTAKHLFPEVEVVYSHNYKDYYKWYEESDLYVGNRVHGSILSLAYSTPAVFLGTDERRGTLNEYLNLLDKDVVQVIKVDRDTLENVPLLIDESIKSVSEIIAKYKEINDKLAVFSEKLHKLYEPISEQLNLALGGNE